MGSGADGWSSSGSVCGGRRAALPPLAVVALQPELAGGRMVGVSVVVESGSLVQSAKARQVPFALAACSLQLAPCDPKYIGQIDFVILLVI